MLGWLWSEKLFSETDPRTAHPSAHQRIHLSSHCRQGACAVIDALDADVLEGKDDWRREGTQSKSGPCGVCWTEWTNGRAVEFFNSQILFSLHSRVSLMISSRGLRRCGRATTWAMSSVTSSKAPWTGICDS